MSEEQAPNIPAAGKDQQPKTYVPSPTGSEATREMREVSRRRRDAEEKLQQHLQEADQLHEAHVQAHLKEPPERDASDAGPRHDDTGRPEDGSGQED
jgi:hypothetical protein